MQERIDLHTHSTASDGTDSPAELVANARAAGLSALALTDHDTLSGLDEAEAAAKALELDFVRGVEISTRTEMGSMHILGLWVPRDASPLEETLSRLRNKRSQRNVRMVAKLNELGIGITMEDVLREAGGESVGRPHMAMAMLKAGYIGDLREAFDKYLGSGGKAYLPKEVMRPEEAVSLMAGLGCCVVLAHPMAGGHFPAGWLEALIRRLIPLGLCGLEAWHSDHSAADTSYLLGLARRLKLCVSGGSDYHGANKPRISLGRGYGGLFVPRSVLEDLRRCLPRTRPC